MAAPWPKNFQQYIDGNTFTESEDTQVVITPVYAGPPKTRRVVTRSFKRVVASMTMPLERYYEFKLWWDNELGGGTLPFSFSHPITGEAVHYKFYQPYKITALGGVYLRVSMEWVESL